MRQAHNFQPGAILHEAIVGAFKARGAGFEAWCATKGVRPSAARNATFGQSRGPKGRALLVEIIEAAGIDVVRTAYRQRVLDHAADVARLEK